MISIDRRARDVLAIYASTRDLRAVRVQYPRTRRPLDICLGMAHGSPTRAGELVRIYDRLATAPVRELSPARVPGRVVAVADA